MKMTAEQEIYIDKLEKETREILKLIRRYQEADTEQEAAELRQEITERKQALKSDYATFEGSCGR